MCVVFFGKDRPDKWPKGHLTKPLYEEQARISARAY